MGKDEIIAKHNRQIQEVVFFRDLENTLIERKKSLKYSCEYKVKQCEKENELNPKNCPILKPWFHNLLHKRIFSKCFEAELISVHPVVIENISIKNLIYIWNKPYPTTMLNFLKPQNLILNTYEEMKENCDSKNLHENIRNAFHFCTRDIIEFRPYNILKLVFPCVNMKSISYVSM
jgi:hypothetical protein